MSSFSCQVEAKGAVSVSNSTYFGSYGIRRSLINETSNLNWNSLETYNISEETLALSMENPYTEGDQLGNIYKGWFVAPATTNYKFYITCNDYC
jgi:hypothetical protein